MSRPAVPEASSGRAARVPVSWRIRQAARFRRHWPWLTVAAVVAVGLAATWLGHWRRGLFMIGAAGLLAAIFRAVLPARRVALLVVRSRSFDVATLVVLGLVIIVLSRVIPTIR